MLRTVNHDGRARAVSLASPVIPWNVRTAAVLRNVVSHMDNQDVNATMIVETPDITTRPRSRGPINRAYRAVSESPSPGSLNLDDVVALAAVVERLNGHALSPNQSSALKCAYQAAGTQHGIATLQGIADALRRAPSYG